MNYIKNNTTPDRPATRLLRIRSVMALTGLSRSYIYQLAAEGSFPQSVPLVPFGTSVGWVEREIEDWIDQRIEARNERG